MRRDHEQPRTLEESRALWRKHYGDVPSLRSVELLDLMLAWCLQAGAEGGLSSEVRRVLIEQPVGRKSEGLEVGTRIVREWRGRQHELTATQGGFVYEGRTYDSLSMIARQITGVRRNGPKFFGLRAPAER